MSTWQWAQPQMFWLLILLLPMAAWFLWQRSKSSFIKMPVDGIERNTIITSGTILYRSLPLLRLIAVAAIILALARPQTMQQKETIRSEGIDIMLVLDVSGSMMEHDLNPSRLEAAKAQAVKFIDARPNDRIGLVAFGTHAFTACLVTIDHDALKKILNKIQPIPNADGTAVGMGLGTAVNRLQNSNGKSKVVILITDGESNLGAVDPLTSADLAKTLGIPVYTILIEPTGSDSTVASGSVTRGEVLLQRIASITNGICYNVSDSARFSDIYKQLNNLMKIKIDAATVTHYSDHIFPLVLIAFIALILEMIFRYTILKTIT